MNRKQGVRPTDSLAHVQKLRTKLSCNSQTNTLDPKVTSSDFSKDKNVDGALIWCSSL